MKVQYITSNDLSITNNDKYIIITERRNQLKIKKKRIVEIEYALKYFTYPLPRPVMLLIYKRYFKKRYEYYFFKNVYDALEFQQAIYNMRDEIYTKTK